MLIVDDEQFPLRASILDGLHSSKPKLRKRTSCKRFVEHVAWHQL